MADDLPPGYAPFAGDLDAPPLGDYRPFAGQLDQPQGPAQPPPQTGWGAAGGGAAAGLGQNLGAAMQGTSPIVRNMQGELNYQRLGDVFQSDAGPAYVNSDGKWIIVDPTKHVILNDPQTNKATVFARSADTGEGSIADRLRAIGHFLMGNFAGPPTTIPSVAKPAVASLLSSRLPQSANTEANLALGGALRSDIAAGGAGPVAISDALTAARGTNTPMNALDVAGENVKALGGQASRVPGTGRTLLTSTLNQRDVGAGARLSGAVDQTGAVGDQTFTTSKQLADKAATDAQPLYAAAYMAPPINPDLLVPGGALHDLMGRPSMQSAMNRAVGIAREEGVSPHSLGLDFNENGDPVFVGVPSWRTLDYVKRGLDDTLDATRSPLTGKLQLDEKTRAILGTQKQYLSILDDQNPAFAQAREAFAGPQAARDALYKGSDAFSASKATDEINAELADLNPSEQSFYRLGYANSLKQRLATTSSGGDEAKAIMGNQLRQDQLRAVFGSKAEDLLAAADRENTMFNTRLDTLRGSQTAGRVAQDVSGAGPGFFARYGQPAVDALIAAKTGEWAFAGRSLFSLARNIFGGSEGGMSPGAADVIAHKLLEGDPSAARLWGQTALNRTAPYTASRAQYPQAIGGMAVGGALTPQSWRQYSQP